MKGKNVLDNSVEVSIIPSKYSDRVFIDLHVKVSIYNNRHFQSNIRNIKYSSTVQWESQAFEPFGLGPFDNFRRNLIASHAKKSQTVAQPYFS